MTIPMIALSVFAGAMLAAVALSLFTFFRVQTLIRRSGARTRQDRRESELEIAALRQTVDTLAAQVAAQAEEIRNQPVAVPAASSRPGMNLNKRSQALRLSRRGDSAEQIAAALELPRQEVELLLKVHRIVLSTV